MAWNGKDMKETKYDLHKIADKIRNEIHQLVKSINKIITFINKMWN